MNIYAIHPSGAQRSGHWIRRWLWLTLLLTWALSARAESGRLEFDHLSVEDGLSQSTVWDIQQDRFGFLWFATADGLNRYDGYTFRIFKSDPDDPTTLAENEALVLYEDQRGGLWIGTRTNGIDHLDRAQNLVTHFPHDPEAPHSLTNGLVRAFAEDSNGFLWVGTGQGLNRLEMETGVITRFQHDPENEESLGGTGVFDLLVDHQGTLWVATDNGLDRYDPEQNLFHHDRHDPANPRSLSGKEIYDLEEDREGTLWIASSGGLDRLDRQRSTLERVFADHPILGEDRSVWHLVLGRRGNLWAGTGNGLLSFDPEQNQLTRFRHDPNDPRSLDHDVIHSLFEDRTGILWVGTYNGLNKYDSRHEQFTTWHHRPGDSSGLIGETVLAVLEDRSGGLWAGTIGDGLTYFDRKQAITHQFKPDPQNPKGLPHGQVRDLLEDARGHLWIATEGGLAHLPLSSTASPTETFTTYRHDPENSKSLSSDSISSLWRDPSGDLWVGSSGGVDRFDPKEGRVVKHYQHDPNDPSSLLFDAVYDVLLDQAETLWVATDLGLSRRDVGHQGFVHYQHERNNRGSLSHTSTVTLFEDSQGTLWVGTYGGGLNRFHREQETFTHYRAKDGLVNDAAVAITEDEQGDLWIATNQGLSRFDPRSETFRNYDSTDGIAGNVFGIGAARRGTNGELFFGASGLTAFFPHRLADDPIPPEVVLTDFHLFYASAELQRSAPSSPLTQSILFTDALTLTHRDYVFAFEFSGLHFAEPKKNRYAYQLEGFDTEWVETDAHNRRVQYSNLRPGEYTFKVRASNKDGKWATEGIALPITVLPPPWLTPWAMGLYVLTAALTLGLGLLWQQRRVEKERKINSRLREVDRLKDEFLANTSHELRTPLYGIIGLAEALVEGVAGEMSPRAHSHLEMVVASGRRLAGLVNDILDFSKLSHKSLELERRPVDLQTLTDIVVTLARPLVGSKNLTLKNSVPATLPNADADENRLQQILLNLVSNAIKFTDEGKVEVSAVAEDGRIEVQVADTGIGISEQNQERIFDSFEQVDAAIDRVHGGTGLGLAVTRQLVGLHGGNLWVESTAGRGSKFFFTLPISRGQPRFLGEQSSATIFMENLPDVQDTQPLPTQTQATQTQATQTPETSQDVPVPYAIADTPASVSPDTVVDTVADAVADPVVGRAASRSHRVLVVDDEPVIREMLAASLAAEGYEVISASSGPAALRLLAEEKVDLVVLDVMMPRMSGYKVCRAIRLKYSLEELPVIFLTARTQVDDLLTGFSEGANDYLAKPVSRGELVARVSTHLKLYEQHRERAAKLKVLRGLLPICGGCKKIRDDDGYWNELELYLEAHSEAELSHGLCPDCVRHLYPDIDLEAMLQPMERNAKNDT